MTATRSPWKRRALAAMKAALALTVLCFVGLHVRRTWLDLHQRGEMPRVDGAWMAASAGLYVAGLCPFGAFFWRILGAGPTPIRPFPALRAYLISHLGKYVPGKAMVVVVRAGLVVPSGSGTAQAVFASFYETLVMMAAGGLVAAAGFAAGSGPSARVAIPLPLGRLLEAPLSILGLGMGLVFLAVIWPSSFPRLAGRIRVNLRGLDLPRVTPDLLAEGMAWSVLGWVLLGLSQVAVIRAVVPGGLAPRDWPLAIASVALATVAGFAIPISPGGLGVREWVLWTALASALDRDLAVVAALLLRLSWVVGEVAVAAALMAIRPAPMTMTAPTPPGPPEP